MMVEEYIITKYYDILKNNRIRCELCPNSCIISEGKSGLCNTRFNVNGKLYSNVYGRPCSINVDPIEKKPLYHFYPGQKILSFGTVGCNLFCLGCQNFDITRTDVSTSIQDTKYVSPEEIVDMAIKNNIKMIAYTYNEPTIFFEYMIDVAKLAKKQGIKNVIVSNGYINPAPLKELCKYIDAANIDLKGITEKFYTQYSKTHLQPVLETIKILHEKKIWLELTNLVIPELNDDSLDINKLCEWITKNIGTKVPLHFSRFYPYYHAANIIPTTPQKLEEAKKIALKHGINYVYIGNLGFLDNTTCNNCGATIIQRDYKHIDIIKLKGKNKNICANCGAILPGIFKS